MVKPHIFAGGAEKVVLYSAQELESMGCQVAVASLSLDLTGLPPKLRNLHFIQSKEKLDTLKLQG